MAVYTTLFVASDAELSELFPGWRAPKARPARVKRKNPFTGENATVELWDPGRKAKAALGPTLFETHGRKLVDPVLPPEDDYQSLLEDNAPALLRTLPHSAMKGVTEVELIALAEALGAGPSPPARFVDCPEDEGLIAALPAAAVGPLAALADRQLRKAAKAWQKALGPAGGSGGLEWALRRLRPLAAAAVTRDGHLFSHARV